jgi:predicted RNA-binding Zn ribbon-like protein
MSFRLPSNRPSLDFLATLGERGSGRNIERLIEPSDLAAWCVRARLVDEGPMPMEGSDVEGARAVREAIQRTAVAVCAGQEPARGDLEALNAAAGRATPVPQLTPGGRDLTRSVPAGGAVAACMAAVAPDAVELFGSPLAARIRSCAAPGCRALFLDLSRPGRRRWCSMDEGGCDNRAKTAALRRRRNSARPGAAG